MHSLRILWQQRSQRADLDLLRQRYARLTPREREVMPLVVSGLLNKQAAAELGISEVTLQLHRRNVMEKMAAASLADLVRINKITFEEGTLYCEDFYAYKRFIAGIASTGDRGAIIA